jgi:hypothetical protein
MVSIDVPAVVMKREPQETECGNPDFFEDGSLARATCSGLSEFFVRVLLWLE